jgi:hypothetical protein
MATMAIFVLGRSANLLLSWAPTHLTRSAENVISLGEQSGHSYDATGRLVFASHDVCVIDCGVLAYSERDREIEGGCKVGDLSEVA